MIVSSHFLFALSFTRSLFGVVAVFWPPCKPYYAVPDSILAVPRENSALFLFFYIPFLLQHSSEQGNGWASCEVATTTTRRPSSSTAAILCAKHSAGLLHGCCCCCCCENMVEQNHLKIKLS